MPPRRVPTQNAAIVPRARSAELLDWYDLHARTLPWRAAHGIAADPYRVWLSEIMLQQTTVQAVAAYYRKFVQRWPKVEDLAAASQDEVLAAWSGLGYYARARNLHKAAKVVAQDSGGVFPRTMEGLRALPGIGAYTAGAIAAIAYDLPEAAMDANAERVIARLFAIETPLPKAKEEIRRRGQSLVPQKRAGDFAQALMDLGSAICTPKRPNCAACPWNTDCLARQRGIHEQLPRKAAKAERPLRRGAAFVARDASGHVLLVRRPEDGLLGGMLQPPLGLWSDAFPSQNEALKQAPFDAEWRKRSGIVRHVFTHFELEIEVYVAEVSRRPKINTLCHSRPSDGLSRERKAAREGKGIQADRPGAISPPGSPSLDALARVSPGMTEVEWRAEKELVDAALPTVMRKIIAHGLDEGGPLFQTRSARKR